MTARLEMYRGDSATIVVEITGAQLEGAVLEGAQLRFTAKRSINDEDADAAISKTSDDGEITVEDNVVTIAIEPADTADMNRRSLVWDLQVTDASGQVVTVAVGNLRILADVSRTTP